MDSKNNFFTLRQLHWILIIAVLCAVAVSFYKYYFLEAFDFFVEAPCDSSTNECYVRDCSTGECPPNELSHYRLFSINASDFASCDDNSCSNLCLVAGGACSEILCSEQSDIECER